MKLYTEEQVRVAMKMSFLTDYGIDTRAVIESLKFIELPSDDDICDEAESIAHNYFVMQRNHYQGLEEGAKRMAYWLMKKFKQEDNGKKI
jgi:hypothetical protein